ncbi:hypothetical protein AX16_006866 [Volvariella volvacea WC 439]|nr:hypothetical protein AX16_006866 [Volvariella volvacea WC 439]
MLDSDRSNIGNARIAGMAEDANLYGLRYNIIAAVFFIPYALFEVPSNIALKLIRPSRWIPSIMLAWGLIMTLMCLCHNFEGLLAARIFLGLAEAGLFPGVTFYLSLWYRRRDIAARISLFFSAATIAGAFGGILAYGIAHVDGLGGLHGWQWIFCIEGIVTVLVAIVAFFYINDYPETARFLNARERAILINMLKEDQQGLATHYEHRFVWQAMTDYKTYVQVAIGIGILVPLYAISLFIPTIIRGLGYSAARAQLMSIPPFVVGCVATIASNIASDRLNLRGPFIVGSALLSLIGYIILYTQTRSGVAYAGTVLVALGVCPCIPVGVAWAGSMAGGDVRRGVVLGMVIGIGNLGGICSSFIYFGPPRFFVGHATMMAFLSLAIVSSCFAMWDYNRLNKKKEAQCQREGIDASQKYEFANMGSESPLFRYTL